MRRADIISAALLLAFGLLVIFVVIPIWVPGHQGGNYGLRAQDAPYLTMIVVTGLALFFLIRRLFFDRSDEANPISKESWGFLALITVILVATLLLLEFVGVLAGGPFIVAVMMFLMGERRPLAIGATAVLAPIAVWAFFWKLLEFPLP
jgi:hypothetical protein